MVATGKLPVAAFGPLSIELAKQADNLAEIHVNMEANTMKLLAEVLGAMDSAAVRGEALA